MTAICRRCGNPIERTATGWGTRVPMRRGCYHRPATRPGPEPSVPPAVASQGRPGSPVGVVTRPEGV